jgi:hypothetical protein
MKLQLIKTANHKIGFYLADVDKTKNSEIVVFYVNKDEGRDNYEVYHSFLTLEPGTDLISYNKDLSLIDRKAQNLLKGISFSRYQRLSFEIPIDFRNMKECFDQLKIKILTA